MSSSATPKSAIRMSFGLSRAENHYWYASITIASFALLLCVDIELANSMARRILRLQISDSMNSRVTHERIDPLQVANETLRASRGMAMVDLVLLRRRRSVARLLLLAAFSRMLSSMSCFAGYWLPNIPLTTLDIAMVNTVRR